MSDEPKRIIVLGTVTLPEDGQAVAFDIPRNASAEEITAALERVEAQQAAAALAETKKLREMFLPESGAGQARGQPP
jgi:hypothetical protein